MIKHNLSDIYKSSGSTVDYTTFSRVVKKFNQKVIDLVCEGKEWPVPLNMGKIELITISRNFSNPQVNWPESMKHRQKLKDEGIVTKGPDNPDGEPWYIYYTDDFYTRIYWNKKNCIDKVLKNFRIYAFKPSWTFKRTVAKALKRDELMELSV